MKLTALKVLHSIGLKPFVARWLATERIKRLATRNQSVATIIACETQKAAPKILTNDNPTQLIRISLYDSWSFVENKLNYHVNYDQSVMIYDGLIKHFEPIMKYLYRNCKGKIIVCSNKKTYFIAQSLPNFRTNYPYQLADEIITDDTGVPDSLSDPHQLLSDSNNQFIYVCLREVIEQNKMYLPLLTNRSLGEIFIRRAILRLKKILY
ncbi:MAG: hypothetical protein QM538_05585 [Methylacidiphilales bacterium]|nr:hypothetical protein [Candidatus Methylacidiphilales bacterium]